MALSRHEGSVNVPRPQAPKLSASYGLQDTQGSHVDKPLHLSSQVNPWHVTNGPVKV
jgi:hypothetical protein